MKTRSITLLLLLVGIGSACNSEDPAPAVSALDKTELNDLLFMWQEEKLAHDVYLHAAAQYELRIFDNIASSEAQHMKEVEQVLQNYGVNISFSRAAGDFSDTTLQALYAQLTAATEERLVDALSVGATIEDLDIYDIDRLKDNTDKTDVLSMYDRLRCGSTNHMRAFYTQLGNQGADYEPQFISEGEFQEIINAGHTSCK